MFAASQAMRTLRRASIDQHQAGGDKFLHTGAAEALETGSDALIEAFASLSFRHDEFIQERFAALAHDGDCSSGNGGVRTAERACQSRLAVKPPRPTATASLWIPLQISAYGH
jgi:hypothetical protein